MNNKQIDEIQEDFKDIDTISLKFAVFSYKGIRMKEEDFTLKFVKPDFNNIDNSKRFRVYRYNKYNHIFDKYYVPTIIPYTFITSDKIEPYKSLPKNTIVVFKKSNKEPLTFSFNFRGYNYNYDKRYNNFNITYINENKKDIVNYPFGGFNDVTVSYENCYKDCEFTNFDFDNIIMDMCISTKKMFYNCRNLNNVNNIVLMKNIIQDMSYMFCYCINIKEIDLSRCNITLDINKVKKMFGFCKNLNNVNIKDIKLYKNDYETINIDDSLFKGCINLYKITTMTETWSIIKEIIMLKDYWIKETEYIAKLNKFNKLNNKTDNKQINDNNILIIRKNKESQNTITSTWLNSWFEDIVCINDETSNKTILMKK